ncbi:MAG: ATPase [Gammaproteobacteria bacterium]|jgi:V/A-type H+-transporting ATPase subunit I|nr:ATPase [Gammaproteobacteria bacterium]MBT3724298.1 ATPase [Gammaproteobacteria bacterium]MBT4196689.1 ATPase [Gammaproteobacteria bacterium]MBT4448512.1 ATPase [Gammaproteobacteria bacterium]MBT4861787.1 ATPase [Gammaproteobacteria bacterium]
MLSIPVEMKKISLTMMDADAQRAALTLARMTILHPVEDSQNEQQLPEFPATPYFDVYHSLYTKFSKITGFVTEVFREPTDFTQLVTLEQLQEMDAQLKSLWALVSNVEEQLRQNHEKMLSTRQLIKSLHKFDSLDLDLSRLKRSSRFLKIMVGTVPSVNFSRLEKALSLAEFMIRTFYTGEGVQHVVMIGSSQQQTDVHELLKSADFRELVIPEEFSGNPSRLRLDLNNQLSDLEIEIKALNKKSSELLSSIMPTLQKSKDLLILAKPYASLATVLKGQGGLVFMQGWIPADSEKIIKKQLENELQFPFHMKLNNPEIKELESVPSLLRHSWIFKPFQSLVSNFGIPNYAEVDPTVLFSFSYILMFGMMFGDVGHGAVIALGSLIFWKRFPSVTIIAVLAGLSSIGFGFVYGSLFGYEHILTPLWMSPMHDPVLVLLLALVWGAFFLVISNLLAIRNYLVVGLTQQAFYSGKGIAGLLFYLAALFSGYQLMKHGQFGVLEMLSLFLPMAVIMRYQWKQTSAGFFEKALVVLIETLEQIISSVSGTLSFLRVAAFSLNHIALAAAVFSIAAMMGTTGHWITIVLGNIFIIVLEGAIVAIQCLRLEYYEGFSRFFSGKGKAFEPLKL